MGKRKDVGIYDIRDPKLKERRRKIKKVDVNKGKRPVMRFDTTSESSDSDSDVRVVRKKKKKIIKGAHYTEVEYEAENQTESENNSEGFILGGKELQLTRRDVALIFGIVCGTKKIPFKKPNARNAKWVKRNFGKDTESSLNKTLIFNRMASILDRTDETSVEDIARLMHCYLMASVLTPGQSSSVSWYLTDYLEDLEGAMTYDWCGYIAAILRNGIRNTRNLKIGGCAMLLPVSI
ncbi:hypothetical protein OROHE_001517 [Orobanche hederae]